MVTNFFVIYLKIFALCSYRNPINEHSINVLKSCRICGSWDLQDASFRKSEFAVEFKEIFGIDIKDDDDTSHPDALCRSHEILFQRLRRHKEMGTISKTSVQLKTFIAHNEDCDIWLYSSCSWEEKEETYKQFTAKFQRNCTTFA